MKNIKTIEELKELAKNYTREEFTQKMADGSLCDEEIVSYYCPNNYKNKIGESLLISKENECGEKEEDDICLECWKRATKGWTFKDDLEKVKEMIRPKYKVGDKVKIREDLKVGTFYGGLKIVPEMTDLIGKEATISNFYGEAYGLGEDIHKYSWTNEMFEGLIKGVSKDEPKQQNKIVTYEEIDTSMNCGYALKYDNKDVIERRIKDNETDLLYFDSSEIKGSDIPELISWLQKVNTYREQILAEPEVEYVDFQTALAWMKEGNKTQLGVYTYYYEYENGQLYFTNGTLNNVAYLNLEEIESKEWILIKEDN